MFNQRIFAELLRFKARSQNGELLGIAGAGTFYRLDAISVMQQCQSTGSFYIYVTLCDMKSLHNERFLLLARIVQQFTPLFPTR